MNQDNLEDRLSQLRNAWPDDSDFVDGVLERINVDSPTVHTGTRSNLMKLSSLVAACVLVAGLAWCLLFQPSTGSVLYADMKAALQKVSSFHTTISVAEPDGTLHEVAHTWFQRGGGFVIDSSEVIRIDNGTTFWEYRKGGKTATMHRSEDPDELLDIALGIKQELEEDCERYEAGDTTEDGVALECYQLTFHGSRKPADNSFMEFDKRRTFVYVDPQSLVKRVESQENIDGTWQNKIVRTWEYNVDVEDSLFKPNFGDDVAIIDADQAFDKLTALSNSIYQEEREGLIYAIHEARRFEDGGVMVMTTVRGSEKTLIKYPLEERMIQPGLYLTEGPGVNADVSPQGGNNFRLELARANQNGIDVQWWMMVPRGHKPDWFENNDGKVEIQAWMTRRGAFAQDNLDERGVIQHIYWTQPVDIPEPDQLPTLAEVAGDVYNDVALLPGVATARLNMGVKDIEGTPTQQFGQTENTTQQQFANAAYNHRSYWENHDVEYQLTEAVKSTSLTGLARDGVTPMEFEIPHGIGLSYYPSVNDETLARAAYNSDLENLMLRGTHITDAGLAHLSKLENLKVLDIAETGITDEGLKHLESISSLRELMLKETKVTAAGVEQLRNAIPELEIDF